MRTHISLPDAMVEEIDEFAGARGRSKFIEDAVRAKLQHEKLGQALKLLKELGPLDPAEHPHWATPQLTSQWVRNLRDDDMRMRESRLRGTD